MLGHARDCCRQPFQRGNLGADMVNEATHTWANMMCERYGHRVRWSGRAMPGGESVRKILVMSVRGAGGEGPRPCRCRTVGVGCETGFLNDRPAV